MVEIVSIRVAATLPGVSPELRLPAAMGLPLGAPAVFDLDGATGWLAAGWRARAAGHAVVVER